MDLNLIFLGPPGSGKGSQALLLKRDYGILHISTGDMLREAVAKGTPLGKKAKDYMDRGLLVPDDIMIEMIEEKLLQSSLSVGFVLDGFPRTLPQAEAIDNLFKKMNVKLTAVFLFNASKDVILDRLVNRRVCRNCGALYHLKYSPPKVNGKCDFCGGELYQRDDDKEETILRRIKVYEEQTASLIDYYRAKGVLVELDANRSVDEVYMDIKRWLETGSHVG